MLRPQTVTARAVSIVSSFSEMAIDRVYYFRGRPRRHDPRRHVPNADQVIERLLSTSSRIPQYRHGTHQPGASICALMALNGENITLGIVDLPARDADDLADCRVPPSR